MNKSSIFDSDTFRLYVPLKKHIELEGILDKNNIKYWIDFENPNTSSYYVRIYFKLNDEAEVNQILMQHDIPTNSDFAEPMDVKQNQKVFLLYLKFFAILVVMLLAIILISSMFK